MASKILLTIDDSFSTRSIEMMDFLKSKDIGAILFCIGERMNSFRSSGVHIKAIHDGFVLGNHSYTHPIFAHKSPEEQRQEILLTETQIQLAYTDAGVRRPKKLFRFPFGMDSFCGRNLVKGMGFKYPHAGNQKYWTWHAELFDGHPIPVEEIDEKVSICVNNAKNRKKTICIVLGHDCPKNIDNGIFEKLHAEARRQNLSFMTKTDIDRYLHSFN